ncbi:MAG: hypothetical protein ACFFDI_24360 [Promethearchaeota archaeon]
MKKGRIIFKEAFLDVDEFTKLQKEFNEETPRSVAVVGCAYLDDFLNKLLKAVLVEDKKLFKDFVDRLTFERRITMCYLFGLIDRKIRDDLKIIGNIRNKFAHDKNLNSFDAKIIRAECEKLNYILEVKWGNVDTPELPRKRYEGAIAYYSGYLRVIRDTRKRINKKTLSKLNVTE